jgi:hypothetical protein
MSPKVYDTQKLSTNGQFLINGPTDNWDPDELAAVVTFVIKQAGNGAVAVGIGETQLLTRQQNGKSFDWSGAVTHISGPAFQTGSATVRAWASIAETNGPDTYECDVDITINP